MPFFENWKNKRQTKHAPENCPPESGVNSEDKDEMAEAPAQDHAAPTESPVLAAEATRSSVQTAEPEPKSEPQPEPEQEPEAALPKLTVPDPFFGLHDHIAYFGFSQQGQSHIASQAPCQDRCCSTFLPERSCLILAIADGVGSCALSDLGAQTAVNSVVAHLKQELLASSAKLERPAVGAMLRSAMQFAYDQVIKTADDHQQLLYSLQSTLTAAIYDGTDLYFAHAGDDGIVALTQDGTLAMATTRHKGEEASSVYPLQEKSTWQFGMVPNTVAFVMATDGVLDAFVRSEFEKNRVYYTFIEPIFTAKYKTVQDAEQICRDFYAYMAGDAYRAAVTDDLTITAVVNVKKVAACLPKFDPDAWNEESRKYEQMRKKALYSHHTEPKQPSAPQNQTPAAPEPQRPDPVQPPVQPPVQTPAPVQPQTTDSNQNPPHRSPGWRKFRKKLSVYWQRFLSLLACFLPHRDPYEPRVSGNSGKKPAPAPKNHRTPAQPAPAPSGKKRYSGWTIFGIAIVASLTLVLLAVMFMLYSLARELMILLLSFA